MDLKQLKYFIAVVENDFNLSKTSKKLEITQPTLSQMIIELEKEYQIKIFNKEFGRFKGLTKVGTKLYRDAKKIINQVEQLNYELKQENDTFKGRVRIGIPPLILSFLCAESIPKFIEMNTDIKLEIVEDNAYALYDMLQRNEIDLAITTEPINHKDIITHEIYNDCIACYVNPQHPFAIKSSVSLKEIAKEKIHTFNEDFIINQQLIREFKKYDIDPEFNFKSGQWDILLFMASYVNGVALIPQPFIEMSALNKKISKMVAIDIKPRLDWDIVIAYNQHAIKNPNTRRVEDFFVDFYK